MKNIRDEVAELLFQDFNIGQVKAERIAGKILEKVAENFSKFSSRKQQLKQELFFTADIEEENHCLAELMKINKS